jgi:hypothetical protein
MSLRVAAGVGAPGAQLVQRFRRQMLAVARTWAAVARTGADVQITSWHRGTGRNKEAGGQEFSQHLLGVAMDAVSTNRTQAQLFALAQRAATAYGTTAILSNRGAVHVQALPNGAVRALVTREPTLVSALAVLRPASPILPEFVPLPPLKLPGACLSSGTGICYH